MKVAAKKQTLKNVTDYITDVICKRAERGYNYGVILIPEGLIDFIPEVNSRTTTISFIFYIISYGYFNLAVSLAGFKSSSSDQLLTI